MLTTQRGTVDLEQTIRGLAAEMGLHPPEIRAELAPIEAHARRFGPEPPE